GQRRLGVAAAEVHRAAVSGSSVTEGVLGRNRHTSRHPGGHRRGKAGEAQTGDITDLDLEGANVDDAAHDAGQAAPVRGRGVAVVAGVDGRAAGKQGHRLRWTAIVLERAEQGIRIQYVALSKVTHISNTADQVVALGCNMPPDIWTIPCSISVND